MALLQTYTVNETGLTLLTGAAVPFNINSINTGCKVIHAAGTPTIEINRSGYYKIDFSSFGSNTGAVVAGTPYSGTYSFQLYNKDVPVVNAVASASSIAATAIENVMFSTILYIPPSCCAVNNNASLTIRYLGQEGTLLNANLSVIRLR